MPQSVGTFDRLRQELRSIKGDRSYRAMADECGLEMSHLWRIINGQRLPYGTTVEKLLGAYPQLAQVFAPPRVEPAPTQEKPAE